MDAVTVYRTYNARGEFENRIKELKRGCGLEGFCLKSFRATECVLRTLMLLHNLIQHFQDRIGLRPASRPKGMESVMCLRRFAFASSSAPHRSDARDDGACCAILQPTPGGQAFKPLWHGFHSKSQLQSSCPSPCWSRMQHADVSRPTANCRIRA